MNGWVSGGWVESREAGDLWRDALAADVAFCLSIFQLILLLPLPQFSPFPMPHSTPSIHG